MIIFLLFHTIQIDFAEIDVLCPHVGRLYGIGYHQEQVDFYQKAISEFMFYRNKATVCEVGLNCGHSTLTFLNHSAVDVINFDLPTQPYSSAVRQFFKQKYANRVKIIDGDSLQTIPTFFEKKKKKRCDIISVDGMHNYVNALQDAMNLMKQSHNQSIILMDDVCEVSNCNTHYRNGENHPYVIGPSQAWKKLLDLNLVIQRDYGAADDRGWMLGRINYNNLLHQIPHVLYNPNTPTNAQEHYIRSNQKRLESHRFVF